MLTAKQVLWICVQFLSCCMFAVKLYMQLFTKNARTLVHVLGNYVFGNTIGKHSHRNSHLATVLAKLPLQWDVFINSVDENSFIQQMQKCTWLWSENLHVQVGVFLTNVGGAMLTNTPHTWIFHFVNSVDEVTVVCCQPCWQVYNVFKQLYQEASMKLH